MESAVDRLCISLDNALKTLLVNTPAARRPLGSRPVDEPALSEVERQQSVRLMRVNHAGEVSAQALYQGQALVARTGQTRRHLLAAATEEADHLAWTAQRLQELDGHPSRLSGVWYAGAFLLGAGAAVLGDRRSLGFLSETERQVEEHLAGHLQQTPQGLPARDARSRAIVSQMMLDEAEHGHAARQLGGQEPPVWIRAAMKMASKVMIHTASRV